MNPFLRPDSEPLELNAEKTFSRIGQERQREERDDHPVNFVNPVKKNLLRQEAAGESARILGLVIAQHPGDFSDSLLAFEFLDARQSFLS